MPTTPDTAAAASSGQKSSRSVTEEVHRHGQRDRGHKPRNEHAQEVREPDTSHGRYVPTARTSRVIPSG